MSLLQFGHWVTMFDYVPLDILTLLLLCYLPLNCNETPQNATAEFLHLSPHHVCSVACVLSGWWGSSGVLLEWTGSLMLSASVLAVPLLTMVSCLCPRQWEFEGQRQPHVIRLCASPCPLRRRNGGEREEEGEREGERERERERERETFSDVGGMEREGQGASEEREAVGILMLKWFDTLGIIASRAMGGERGSPTERLIRMSPKPISWSGRSET